MGQQVGHFRYLPLMLPNPRGYTRLLICSVPLPSDPKPLLCIDLALPMGWFNSSDLFYTTSITVKGMAVISFLTETKHVLVYTLTSDIYHTSPAPTSTNARLQYDDVYMDDINCLPQGDPMQQQRVT